jgi:murein DD-endopeptidase MepM/ murein hydrolase activator NlpD
MANITPFSYRPAVLDPSTFAYSKLGFDNAPVAQNVAQKLSPYASLVPPSMVQVANSTPQIYKNLSANINQLGTVTTPYGGSTKFEKFHPGVDVANKIGTPIPAFAGGTVVSVDTGHKQGDKAYGNTVTIVDQNGDKHRYSHLNQVLVKVGQKVGRGQEVATMGNTGQTYSTSGGTGSHLDYRIVDAYNRYVNPYTYLKKLT